MSKTRKPRGLRASEEGLKKVQQRMAELEKPEDKERKGWTQEDLEKRSGASLSTVRRFLDRQPIDKTRAIWITQALGFELTEVVELSESNWLIENLGLEKTASIKRYEDEFDGLEEQNQRSLITIRSVPLNPFVPLAGIVDNAQQFFNREQEIERIFDVFNSGGSVALIGEEAIGKSSLLKAICRQAESRLHSLRQPVYLDLNGVCDEGDFYSALCHEVGIPESKGYRLTRELRAHRLLLALDNVGKITCEGFSHHVRDQLRGLAEGSDAPLRLLLSATEPLDTLFEDSQDGNKTSPLAGICQEEYLEPWNETTARTFITARLALTAVQFTEEEIFQLVQESCGYPQQLMRLCNQTYSQYAENEYFSFFFRRWQQKLQARFVAETRLDTPARAAAAGFWHLHEGELKKAAEAFTVVRSLPYGEEMFILAQTLLAFSRDGIITDAPQMPIPPVLRPASWKAIAGLHQVVEDIRVIERSVSRSTRSFALNRALGELTDLLKEAHTLPEPERQSIALIANSWREALLQGAGEIGEISITEPVRNPYVVGDPVEGDLFVGREDVLSQLEELWVMGHQLQSVVLYGHRRMGKTSILKNAANCLGASLKVVYVHLLSLGNISQGVGEMLMAISDEIALTVIISAPDDADLLNLPYRTFERYLKQVDAQLGEEGLIIALDEFEQIEEFIAAGQIHQDFIKFLRGLVQMSSKVAFVFAGLHTLEEMTEDYFHPFFASIIPIHVGFFTPESTHQLLANPTEDFPLDYNHEALERIYTLTAGQPFLIQLVGFWLVRRYNNQVFEQRRARDPVFTVEDVEAVINDSEFFKRGRYYFTGVWSQAAQGAEGQQAILKAIAPHPEGLSIDALAQATRMEEETLYKALETLKRHDVIEQTDERWRIIVELFRRWVLDS